MNLQDLKSKTPADLLAYAEELEIENASTLRKQDMLDAQQIGGVTGWMRAAALAQTAGQQVSSHLFVEYSAHLLPVTPTCHWLEYLDVARAVLVDPPSIVDGCLEAPDRPGAGLVWDANAVKRHRVE